MCPTFFKEQSPVSSTALNSGEMRSGDRFDNSSQLPSIKRNCVSLSEEILPLSSHGGFGLCYDGNGGQAYFTNDLTMPLSVSLPANCVLWRTAMLIQKSGFSLESTHSCFHVLCEIQEYF